MTLVTCIGHAVEDYLFRIHEMPTTPKKHRAQSFEVVGGGPAANASVAIARLGGRAELIARLGDDKAGESIVRSLNNEGVDTSRVSRFYGRQSSVSSILVDDQGERLIVNYADPELPTDGGWVKDAITPASAAVLADCRWLEGAIVGLNWAKEMHIPGILDADHPMPESEELLAAASHLAFSADGLADIVGHRDHERGILEIASAQNKWCAVTVGADGTYFVDGTRVVHVPAPQVAAVDTLGAGDVWHGAFALGIARGMSEHEAVAYANIAAALKVTRPGGRDGAPTADEINHFNSTHKSKEP